MFRCNWQSILILSDSDDMYIISLCNASALIIPREYKARQTNCAVAGDYFHDERAPACTTDSWYTAAMRAVSATVTVTAAAGGAVEASSSHRVCPVEMEAGLVARFCVGVICHLHCLLLATWLRCCGYCSPPTGKWRLIPSINIPVQYRCFSWNLWHSRLQ